MSENKKEAIAAMQKMARAIQRALSQYGDAIAMGTEPTVVVFQANATPDDPEAKRMWHAGIVYRQHVAPKPEIALGALGHTIAEATIRLDAQAAGGDDVQDLVKEIPGGGVALPDVWE